MSINVNEILNKVNQEELYFKYLNIVVQYRKLIKAVHRNDKRPTVSFKWFNNKLRYCDWGTGEFLDIFDLIGRVYKKSFREVIEMIKNDYPIETLPNIELEKRIEETTEIDIEIYPKWLPEHIAYWKQYHFDGEHCRKHNIVAVKNAWINKKLYYAYNKNQVCFAYYYPDDTRKLYLPYENSERRFRGNSSYLIGWEKLPKEGEYVVITKSHKDVACYDLFEIPAVSTQAESIIIDIDKYKELEKRFDYVIINLDYDSAGIKAMKKYKELFKTNNFLFKPLGKDTKDFSGFIKKYGIQETIDLIEYYKLKI